MALTISGITLAGSAYGTPYLAPEESATLKFTMANTTGRTISSYRVRLVCTVDGTTYEVLKASSRFADHSCNLANNKSLTVNITVKSAARADAWTIYKYMRDSHLRGVQGMRLIVTANDQSYGQALSAGGAYLEQLTPLVTGLSLKRCDATGTPDDEGTYALISLRAYRVRSASLSPSPSMVCALTYNGQTVDLTAAIGASALSDGVTDSTALVDAGVIFPNGQDCTAMVTFGDTYEAYSARTTLTRAFANLHLSSAKDGGVAFGRFSSATDNEPKFECEYPAWFNGGIVGVTNYSGSEVPTGGTWIDGRKVYRRVVTYALTQTGTAVTGFTIPVFGAANGQLIRLDGCVTRTSDGKMFPVNFHYSSSTYCSVHVSAAGEVIFNSTFAGTFYVIIEYAR